MRPPFDSKFIQRQKEVLLHLKAELLNTIRYKSNDDLLVPSDEIVEDGDQAQTYINQNVSFGLREREIQRLKEIDSALLKMENGTYGICEETDEPIEKKRLEKIPWAKLSIQAAEELEREADGRSFRVPQIFAKKKGLLKALNILNSYFSVFTNLTWSHLGSSH